jgi:hypothetical protein
MTDDGLTRLSKLADDLFDAETQVTLIETQLRAAQKKVRDLSEFQIPELMDELEVSTFKTKSGVSVEVAAARWPADAGPSGCPGVAAQEWSGWLDQDAGVRALHRRIGG